MIGPMSSSLALAQRTADTASARMAKVSRQMATGKDVASARDDGARYVQAAALQSQRVTEEARAFTFGRIDAGLAFTHAITDQFRESIDAMEDIVLRARTSAAGSQARITLQAEWTRAVAGVPASTEPSPGIADWSAHNLNGSLIAPQDPMMANARFMLLPAANGFASWLTVSNGTTFPVAINAVDISSASTAQLDQASVSLESLYTMIMQDWDMKAGGNHGALDALKSSTAANIDRLDTAIGSLTDADLGKLSIENRQAQTRQQLALATISRALSAYGSYAGSLLGNVLQTQRGIMA
jgi:flagellin-like hook-associated protein FlgL